MRRAAEENTWCLRLIRPLLYDLSKPLRCGVCVFAWNAVKLAAAKTLKRHLLFRCEVTAPTYRTRLFGFYSQYFFSSQLIWALLADIRTNCILHSIRIVVVMRSTIVASEGCRYKIIWEQVAYMYPWEWRNQNTHCGGEGAIEINFELKNAFAFGKTCTKGLCLCQLF